MQSVADTGAMMGRLCHKVSCDCSIVRMVSALMDVMRVLGSPINKYYLVHLCGDQTRQIVDIA